MITQQKKNYQKELDWIISEVEKENERTLGKQTLLLHACCAPCSSAVVEYLSNFFSISIYYYNPNIHPEAEYMRRLNELKEFLPRFPSAEKIPLIADEYNPVEYFTATNVKKEPALQKEKERGERCRRCYLLRMQKTYEYAKKNKFDWFTTTLSISPYKDADKINTIGKQLEEEKGPKFLTSDFKKRNGFLRSLQLSDEYGLYRQDYCGCIYSKQNMR
ncbi:MAG: epoxyqueuosine reductase QueH [Treponema sp.]|jgi:predicted adenine nucleotide alpha hydrolase (AANH) superfamily ATPase|nr:epoxyqueuosine reductase QueH [Treponema sp.]